jgi:hypothetical protein
MIGLLYKSEAVKILTIKWKEDSLCYEIHAVNVRTIYEIFIGSGTERSGHDPCEGTILEFATVD